MPRRRLARLAPLRAWLLLLLVASSASAGGSRADYERAAGLARRFADKLVGEDLEHRWLDAETLFYRRPLRSGGWRFVEASVDGTDPKEAFDHGAVASGLGRLLGSTLDADRLPLEVLADQDGTLQGVAQQRIVGIESASGTVRELEAESVPALRLPNSNETKSHGGGRDTSILFVNRASTPVQLVWIDHAGRPKPYATVAPGARLRQPTFPGHLWRAVGSGDVVLGTWAGRKRLGVAVIPDAPLPVTPDAGDEGSNPGRSPDGRWVAFVRDHDVWVRASKGGRATRLSKDGTAGDRYTARMRWSPDARTLMVVQEKPAPERSVHVVNSVPEDRLQPELVSYPYRKPGDPMPHVRPRLFDVPARRPIPFPDDLYRTPWSISHLGFSPDSKRFTFLYNQRGHDVLRLVELDLETRTARALIDEVSKTFIDYSQKTFLHGLTNGDWLWMSERSGRNHLYHIDGQSGAAQPLTQGNWIVREVLSVDEDAGTLSFSAHGAYPDQDPYHRHVGRIGLDGTGLVWLSAGDGTHELTFSPDGAHYVDRWSRVDQPPVFELRRTRDGALCTTLAHADAAPLTAAGWRAPERFVAKGRDGKTDIHGVIHVPTTFDPTRRYPVIENIYAGPHGFFVPKKFRVVHKAQRLAELGFVVVQIDGMGTNWRTKAFHDVCWKDLGDAGLPDRVAWIRAAAADRPWMDTSRVGIYGGSAGGQSALRALLTHGDFYQVAVADCGCHDNRMDKIWWNEAWMGWPVGPHYAEQSNVTQAHRLEGKLLLIVGEVDRNVDPASTLQVVDALIKADKDFDLLVIPGAGHGAAESPYGRRRRADFFVRHLLGVEPRAPVSLR